MWESVELRDIRAFLVLADELHFGRTAERLGLTQSRVSQTIRTLEARLGGPLFERTSRRVRLTALGERLRDAAEPAYADLQRALADVYATGREISGELRLGVLVSSSGGPALIDIIQAFESRHGGCRVQIVELALSDSLEPLRRGEVDLMAIRLPIAQPDLTAGPVLSREERVVAVATDHPFAAREAVSLEDLADQTVADGTNLPPELREGLSPSYPARPADHARRPDGHDRRDPGRRRPRRARAPNRAFPPGLLRAPRSRLRPLQRCAPVRERPGLAHRLFRAPRDPRLRARRSRDTERQPLVRGRAAPWVRQTGRARFADGDGSTTLTG